MMKTKKNPTKEFDGMVIMIDETILKIIRLYLSLYSNYDEAAAAVSINRDTLVKYNTFSRTMAVYIFERIVDVLEDSEKRQEFYEVLGFRSTEDIISAGVKSDHTQKDNVMYEINESVHALLKKYYEPFPNLGAAGSSVGINPRTFKAYLDGSIESLPKKYFWRLIRAFEHRGVTQDELKEELGISDWREVINSRSRTPTLQITKEEFHEEMIKLILEGRVRRKDFSKTIVNAGYRLFGSFGKALKMTLVYYMKKIEEMEMSADSKNLKALYFELVRFRKFLKNFLKAKKSVLRALPKKSRVKWMKDIPNLKKLARTSKQTMERVEFDKSRQYRLDGNYSVGEVIHHPGFGLGQVLTIKDRNRMIVEFYKRGMGQKTLIMNRKY